jgi:hypothetical protein
MRRPIGVITVFLVSALLATPDAPAQEVRPGEAPQQPYDVQGLRQPFERFDGRITVRTRDGRVRELHVVIRNWIIDRGHTIPRFPEDGFLLVQLRGGQVFTVIEGQRLERHEDEFWAVRAGASMLVETGNDSAILQTVAVRSVR